MLPPRLVQLARYASVSAIATVTSLSVLGVLVGGTSLSAGWANVIATAVGTLPSFELNRRWVWGKRGGRSATREVLPFVLLCTCELLASTWAVHEAAAWASSLHAGRAARTVLVEAANVATFGSLWLVQFALLDRVLFRARASSADVHAADGPSDDQALDLRRALEDRVDL